MRYKGKLGELNFIYIFENFPVVKIHLLRQFIKPVKYCPIISYNKKKLTKNVKWEINLNRNSEIYYHLINQYKQNIFLWIPLINSGCWKVF